jgi:ribosomal protein S27E
MQAVNKKFHEKCFKCTECRINVARTVFYESRGVVYCEVCYRTIITNIFRGK